jgi:hypothetical protein
MIADCSLSLSLSQLQSPTLRTLDLEASISQATTTTRTILDAKLTRETSKRTKAPEQTTNLPNRTSRVRPHKTQVLYCHQASRNPNPTLREGLGRLTHRSIARRWRCHRLRACPLSRAASASSVKGQRAIRVSGLRTSKERQEFVPLNSMTTRRKEMVKLTAERFGSTIPAILQRI